MRRTIPLAVAFAAAIGPGTADLAAQRASERRVANPGETQFELQLLRPSGGPVVPIFEGWYRNPDGTFELSFGYFSVNTEETLEIPLGSDNFIEPAEFDGRQPTVFEPVPDSDRRHWGAFTVTVPADFGSRDVVWTLHVRGQTLSVPGRLTSPAYELAGLEFPGRSSVSPVLRLAPDGPGGRGPRGITGEALQAQVGVAVDLGAWVARDAEAGIDAVNFRREDWNGGLTTLYHRFGRLALGWDAQQARQIAELVDAGIDGVYSDHVDRMVETLARFTDDAGGPVSG